MESKWWVVQKGVGFTQKLVSLKEDKEDEPKELLVIRKMEKK